ncbi:MAG: M1 family metallopeptidase [Polyangiaceae bacterium]|nr:M1 family metallopeptidase [Polyangiaceae bacterium]
MRAVSSLACHSGCSSPLSLTQGPRRYERSRPFRVEHLALDLALDFAAKRVSGSASLDLLRVDSEATAVVLDAVDFDVHGVALVASGKSQEASYHYDGEQLTVTVPRRVKRCQVVVSYAAEPTRGLYFLEPDARVPGRPRQVYSQCQDEDARYWFPCHDKPHQKMTTSVKVRVPAGMTVLSNGELVSHVPARQGRQATVKAAKQTTAKAKQTAKAAKKVSGKAATQTEEATDRAGQLTSADGGQDTFHFKLDTPHPSYLVTLVAGDFEVWTERVELAPDREVELAYYVPPGRRTDGERAFEHTRSMLRLFSEKTGVPYPFSRYSQIVVADFMFGGMENTTATTLEEDVLLDAKAARDIDTSSLVAHELAHQWFGDLVTCRDWSHAWLNEGFATFCELVDREARFGRDEYDYALERDLASYLGEAARYRRAVVCRDYDAPIDLFDRHLYEKGALVLHLLCRELGEERFWRGVGRYLTAHAGGVVETLDLTRALEAETGVSLERFFDTWVYQPGHPELGVKVSYESGLLTIDFKQKQRTERAPLYDLWCEVELGLGEGRTARHARRVDTKSGSLTIKLSAPPEWVEVDPELRLLGRVDVDCPQKMLEEQLLHGPRARSRWAAAQLLGKKGGRRAIAALARCLGSAAEPWMVRVEAARALGRLRDERGLLALLPHVSAAEHRVRRAVIAALGRYKDPRVEKALVKHARADMSYLVQGEAARALGQSRGASASALLPRLLSKPAWGDAIRVGALGGLAALGEPAAEEVVLESTAYGVPTRGRRAAVLALPEVSESRRARRALEDLLDDAHPHVRGDVARALELMGDSRAAPALRARLAREPDPRVQRRLRLSLQALAAGPKQSAQRTARELTTLQEKVEALEARLSQVEQKKKGKRS